MELFKKFFVKGKNKNENQQNHYIPELNIDKQDLVHFGRYMYDINTIKPIEWIVLDENDNEMLLLSKQCLDTIGYIKFNYQDDAEDTLRRLIWEFSDLRKWLNDYFYNTAFNSVEKKYILNTKISTTDISANTNNNIFILSEQQVKDYLNNPLRRCASPTPYALQNKAVIEPGTECSPYWILPHVEIFGGHHPCIMDENLTKLNIYPKAITGKGVVYYHSRNVFHTDFTVRPALRIDRSIFDDK